MNAEQYAFFPDIGAEVELPRRGIHSQTLWKAHGVELVLFGMAPGEQLSEHTAARAAIIHVLSGDGALTVAGDEHQLSPGSWLAMPARTTHAVVARAALSFALYLLPA